MKILKTPYLYFALLMLVAVQATYGTTSGRTILPPLATQQPALEEWKDDFDGSALDGAKWERFKIEGGEANLNVREGQVQLSGADGSRAGIRSKQQFSGDRFIAEATVAKITAVKPQPFGNAVITLLFDDTGRNRIEWIINNDGKFEAWDITNGKNERFDDRQSSASAANAKLGIARRGADFFFTVNDQVKLQRTIPNLPATFRVMLYGFGTSQNDWASARILMPKQTAAAPAQTPAPQAAPVEAAPQNGAQAALDEWGDDFNADQLDETKWERYTFDGGSGGKSEVKDGQLRQRGVGGFGTVGSRAGVRSKKTFRAESFYVEAKLAKSGLRLPGAGGGSGPLPGLSILTVMFEGNPANRLEWIMTSDGRLEAWDLTNGKSTRLDNQSLGTREKNPRLGIARRGNEIMFMLNGQVGLQRTISGISPNFKVMLYGFATSENNWDSIIVQTKN